MIYWNISYIFHPLTELTAWEYSFSCCWILCNVIKGAVAIQLEPEFVFQGGYAAYRYAQPATATAAAYSDR